MGMESLKTCRMTFMVCLNYRVSNVPTGCFFPSSYPIMPTPPHDLACSRQPPHPIQPNHPTPSHPIPTTCQQIQYVFRFLVLGGRHAPKKATHVCTCMCDVHMHLHIPKLETCVYNKTQTHTSWHTTHTYAHPCTHTCICLSAFTSTCVCGHACIHIRNHISAYTWLNQRN